MASTRVVVTGLGVTSPVGGDVPSTWEALLAGRSGVRALTEEKPELVVLALDAKSASCTISREKCLQELGSLAPELLPFAELFCRRRSQYFFWDGTGQCHRLQATDGVDQGDPLAPLLFACGVQLFHLHHSGE